MKRTSNSYYIALALIIIIGCFYYGYSRLIPKYKKDKQDLAQVQAEVKAIDDKIQALQGSKQTLDELGDIVDKMLVAVPAGKDAPNLITELESLAIKYRVYIPSIQISDPESNPGAALTSDSNIVSVAFSVNGSFSDLHQFIRAVEKDQRFMAIKNITISAVGDQVSMSIQLETYKRSSASATNLSSVSTSTNSDILEVAE